MTTIYHRLAKLEAGKQPPVHRPQDMSASQYLHLMFKALDALPPDTSDDERVRVFWSWADGFTHDELTELLEMIDGLLQELEQGRRLRPHPHGSDPTGPNTPTTRSST